MIPATNWYAIYSSDTDTEFIKVALVCWVLGSSGDYTPDVFGMVATDDGKVIKAPDYNPDGFIFLRYDLLVDDIDVELLPPEKLN